VRRINLERWDDRTYKWLFLLSFDLDQVDELQLEETTDRLLRMCAHNSKTARLIMPGDNVGLLYWNEEAGWHESAEAQEFLSMYDRTEG
jgi:hypothetical protein